MKQQKLEALLFLWLKRSKRCGLNLSWLTRCHVWHTEQKTSELLFMLRLSNTELCQTMLQLFSPIERVKPCKHRHHRTQNVNSCFTTQLLQQKCTPCPEQQPFICEHENHRSSSKVSWQMKTQEREGKRGGRTAGRGTPLASHCPMTAVTGYRNLPILQSTAVQSGPVLLEQFWKHIFQAEIKRTLPHF